MLGLNELFETHLDQKGLIELAGQIGSDVPFFIVVSAAICRGRGEIVEPAVLPTNFSLLLVKPDFGVPTPWVYGRWKDSRELPGVDYASQEFSGVRFVNDLERPVFEKFVPAWVSEDMAAPPAGSGRWANVWIGFDRVCGSLRDLSVDAEGLAARVL